MNRTFYKWTAVLLGICLLLGGLPLTVGASAAGMVFPESLVDTVRAAMCRRESPIRVTVERPAGEVNAARSLQAYYDWMVEKLEAAVLSETDAPNEGDYLYYHIRRFDTGASVEVKGGVYLFDLRITPTYLDGAAEETAVGNRLKTLMPALVHDGMSEYEKAKAIHDYIITHVTYDEAHLNDPDYRPMYTAYAALITGTAVCQGYASLFYRMARMAGLGCRVVSGYAGAPHAWNIVRLGGLWYYVDCTWDSTAGDDRFFLKNEADMVGHSLDEEFRTSAFYTAYPISAVSYHVHVPVTLTGVSPTCTSPGLTEGQICGACGEILVPQSEIPAYGHQWDFGARSEDGTVIYTCTVCGVTQTRGVPDPAQRLPGDVNNDGAVGADDARLALRRSVDFEIYPPGSVNFAACDVNCDRGVGADDARLILRASVGLEDLSAYAA